jgi:hypothetical protein
VTLTKPSRCYNQQNTVLPPPPLLLLLLLLLLPWTWTATA